MADAADHGRFVWFDLMTGDPVAAVDFYTELVGWSTQPWEGGDAPYTMWSNGDTPLGGVVQLPEEVKATGAPPHWISYVAVADVKQTADRAAELGGQVMQPPTEIPSVGTFAVIQDPQGAVFALHSSARTS